MSRDVCVVLGAVLLCCLIVGVPAEGFDIYLEGYQGPYRGRVVDAETKEPIAGAAVVAVWMRDKVYPLHMTSAFFAAREALTAKDGTFAIDGKDLEAEAPARTRKPHFEVFFPGFGSFSSRVFLERGFQRGTMSERAGMTIGLPRLRTRQERLEVVRHGLPPTVPDELMPSLIRLVNEESASIGVPPIRGPK